MSVSEVLGTQWGDEGKGKITNILAEEADAIIKSNGGANAGHSVEVDGERFALHLLPSSITNPNVISIIGPGVVVDLDILHEEITALRKRGITITGDNLKISSRAHIVFPWHKILDGVLEEMRKNPIGTTRRGIGIAYAEKAYRVNVRMGDLVNMDEKELRTAIIYSTKPNEANQPTPIDFTEIWAKLPEYKQFYGEFVCDTECIIQDMLSNNAKLVIEGAQATGLDIDFGTYPDVTSSSCTASGIAAAAGIGPLHISNIFGVAKCYTSRVGEGPFPTELFDEDGKKIRELGHEYGTTTGRPRRTGWLDLVWLKYAVGINSINYLVFNHADTIGKFEKIKVCTAYMYKGEKITYIPEDLGNCEPVYTELDGNWPNIQGLYHKLGDGHEKGDEKTRAREFFEFIEEYLNNGKLKPERTVQIAGIGWGPAQDDIEWILDIV